MKNYLRSISIVAALLVAVLTPTTSLFAKPEKTEEELIQDLSDPKDAVVKSAMLAIEKRFPHSPKATPLIKAALKDSRPEVRRKAARVLGVWHEELSAAELKDITVMLKTNERYEVTDALKALGDMRAKAAIPEILPCLKNENSFIVRDAWR